VLFISKAQEKATVFRTEKRKHPQTGKTYPWIVRSTAMVNQYYVYAIDADFGPFFLKFCSYFPYNAKLCLNGHEYVKRQLAREGIGFEALDNGIRVPFGRSPSSCCAVPASPISPKPCAPTPVAPVPLPPSSSASNGWVNAVWPWSSQRSLAGAVGASPTTPDKQTKEHAARCLRRISTRVVQPARIRMVATNISSASLCACPGAAPSALLLRYFSATWAQFPAFPSSSPHVALK
jgi:hypothetical protein